MRRRQQDPLRCVSRPAVPPSTGAKSSRQRAGSLARWRHRLAAPCRWHSLASLGIGGAWIGNFTQLAPYQPYFIAATLAFIGAGYWLVYRSSKVACVTGDACARQLPSRLVKIALIAATVMVIAAVAFDFLAPYVLS